MIFDQWKQILFDPYKQILFDQQKQWSFDPCKQISLINRAKYYLIDQTGAATAKDSKLLRRRMKYKRAQKTKDKYGWGKIQSPKAFQWIRKEKTMQKQHTLTLWSKWVPVWTTLEGSTEKSKSR